MAEGPENEQTLERMMRERREKVQQLRDGGRNPYRNDFVPNFKLGELREKYEGTKPEEHKPGMVPVDGERVRVAGRLVARRGFGKTVFAPIRDGSGQIQLYLNIDKLNSDDFESVLPALDVGDFIGAEGVVFWTKRGEMSVLCDRLFLLTKALRPLPDKWGGLNDVEIRYRQRYLDMVVNPDVRDVFRKRSQIVRGIRSFLDARGYLEVETPMMHPIIGGAAARPFTTHHNALNMPLYMRIAPELYLKRLVVGGLDRVYEINRNFRNEGLSRQHNPEFTMLEFYQAYATYEDLMNLTEEMVVGLAKDLNGTTECSWDGKAIELEAPWRRLSVRDAVVNLGKQPAELFDDTTLAAETAVKVGVSSSEVAHALLERLDADAIGSLGNSGEFVAGFKDASSRSKLAQTAVDAMDAEQQRIASGHLGYMIFEQTAEDKLVEPTFLTDFPLAVSPLARKKDDDPAYCDRFELMVAGTEIANAFSELNDPDDQRARFAAQVKAKQVGADETMDYDEDYCRALELGMPPAAGEGIGIDRLTMLLTGQTSIRDVILFPLMRPEG